MFVALCALIFVLPASIALLDSFAGITVFFYLAKKINRMTVDWTVKASRLNFLERILYVWKGFAPVSNVLNRPLQILVLAFFLSVLLFPYLASVRAGDRATEFRSRCRQLKIEGVTLHSYRYA